ncbi:MAG: Gar1/Naf1 family protein [Candidatus Bathyarchaeia archaeon]
MQRFGKVMHVTSSRNIVVKTLEPPQIGSAVVDENLRVVGKVFDVIGSVAAPYAVIKPKIKDSERVVGKQLYLLLSKKERNKRL